jgi:DNA-binding transcriptional LysR family regulator
MDMRLFEYALEIYKTKSFTKAASRLHIAQPSKLGVYLFDRKPGSVELTPDGLCFVKQAEKILQMRDDLRREILERKEGIRGELKIGSTAITGGHILPPLLRIYKERYPNVCIQLLPIVLWLQYYYKEIYPKFPLLMYCETFVLYSSPPE